MRHDVAACIYVSTYNVVFCGQEIINGNEELPYVADDAHVDHYSRTKCAAEQAVLQANGRGRLRTCALRPAGIYGESEKRHLPRITGLINQGLGFFSIGSPDILCDWVHADNLVHALLLAAAALAVPADNAGAAGATRVAGRAFHIADGFPINNFAFMQRIFGTPGLFWLRVPTSIMYAMAAATEAVHRTLAPVFVFEPFLTKAEVCKVGYTHYMDMTGPREALGYEPIISAEVGG